MRDNSSWIRNVLSGGAATLSDESAAWLFGRRGSDEVAQRLGGQLQSSVVEFELDSRVGNMSLMDRVFRPTLVEPSANGSIFGQGWVLDAPARTTVASSSDLRRMRYVVRTDVSGHVGTQVSVAESDGSFVLASITAASCGKILMCNLQCVSSSGEAIGQRELHAFTRLCDQCGSEATACACSQSDTGAQGLYSPMNSGIWILKNEATQMMSVDVSSDAERVMAFESLILQTPLSLELETGSEESIFDGNLELGLESLASSVLTWDQSTTMETVPTAESMSVTKGYPCKVCHRVFSQSGHRNEHYRRMHEGKGHQCPICNHIFGVPSKLRRHMRNVHQKHELTCPHSHCHVQLTNASQMEVHLQNHAQQEVSLTV